jgi:hypothetical protein
VAETPRQRWFSQVLQSGLELDIFGPGQVLAHVTPEIMANNLPPDIMSQVLQASLSAGAMTPERVLETLSPELLAEHIPHEVLWDCVAAAAERAGFTKNDKSG